MKTLKGEVKNIGKTRKMVGQKLINKLKQIQISLNHPMEWKAPKIILYH